MAFEFENFITYVTFNPADDFFEMEFHHILTLFLCSISYCLNQTKIGIIVMVLGEFTDVFLRIVRGFLDVSKVIIIVPFYIGLASSWIYLRCYLHPYVITYNSIYRNLYGDLYDPNRDISGFAF